MGVEATAPDPPRAPGASLLLLLLAGGGVVHALAIGPVLGVLLGVDPARGAWVQGVRAGGVALWLGIGAGAFGLLASVAALGVRLRQPWGWVLGAGVAVMWLPSGCAPVALAVLGMLWASWPKPPGDDGR